MLVGSVCYPFSCKGPIFQVLSGVGIAGVAFTVGGIHSHNLGR